MNKIYNLWLILIFSSIPCFANEEKSAKHQEIATKLARQQDELQADTSDLILGETNVNVISLLKKCRHSMNDAVDLLEAYQTGGQTLAAQSEVIELIYQAAKEKMTGPDGKPKPGGRALMDMLRQLLGMDNDDLAQGQQMENEIGDGEGQNGAGKNPGKGMDGHSNMASTQQLGISNPDMATDQRSVPKSAGVSTSDMPVEFHRALEAYNKTLQK